MTLPEDIRAMTRKQRRAAIEAARADAAVALDAELLGRMDMDPQLSRLLALALVEYRLKFKKPNALYLYRWVHRGHARENQRHLTSLSRGDAYCTFCGLLLAQDVARGRPEFREVAALHDGPISRHVVPCALACLTGMKTPGPPDTRRFTDDTPEAP